MNACKPLNILVLCTGNSARSILGEALIGQLGAGRLTGFSAGSRPAGRVNPGAVALLRAKGIDPAPLASKSWHVVAGPDAPVPDIAITVCDSAASESGPVWPGTPVRVHWGLPDPAAVGGPPDAVAAAFERTWRDLRARVEAMLALPLETMPASPALRQTGRVSVRAHQIGKAE